MTNEELQKAYQKLSYNIPKYEQNKAYMMGKNPELYAEPKRKDPDNRIPVPLAKATVEDMTGYAGSDIDVFYQNISTENPEEQKEDEYNDLLQQVQKYNDDKLLMAEVYKECLAQKEAYLLFWVSDELGLDGGMLTPEYQIVTMAEMVIYETNSLKPEIEKAVRFVKNDDDSMEAHVYLPGKSEAYISKNGASNWTREPKEDLKYPYTSVPVVKFKMSKNGGPMFEAEKPLIDAHDKGLSKTQDEIDRFNALIALLPGKVTDEFVRSLEQKKVIDDLENYKKWPAYLEKNLNGVDMYVNKQLDRLERLYHKTIKVPDMTTQDFASGDESGVARAFKLLGMEFKATEVDSYFIKGFTERTKLFNDVITASTISVDTQDYTTKVVMHRNLPVDLLATAQIATQLKGLVSDETLLRFLPSQIVEDVDKELLKLEETQSKQNEELNNLLNGQSTDEI